MKNLYKLFAPGNESFNEGKGLDLAIVNLIMDAHGGKFEVANKPEGGAVVKLFFPK